MDRSDVLKLICDAADKARRGSHSPSDQKALELLAWTQRNVERFGLQQALGIVIGASRMFGSCHPPISNEISHAYFVVEEIMRYDGLIPEQQVREAARKLSALGEKQAA